MKIIRKKNDKDATQSSNQLSSSYSKTAHVWKVLIVDDEPDIHEITKLNLKGFNFENRVLEFYHAYSAQEAKEILYKQKDIAVALIDVVMESDNAGLKLVEDIREELQLLMIRLIIRTGQPGQAPERYVIDNYDIDDYKDKTELTVQKLYTTVRSALKSYRDLLSIDMNRKGLLTILNATPEIYSHRSLQAFFEGMLTQIVSLYNLDSNSIISTLDGLVATIDQQKIKIQAGTGDFSEKSENKDRMDEITQICSESIMTKTRSQKLTDNTILLTLNVSGKPIGFVYLEPISKLSEEDYNLIQLFANQCSAALETMQLNFDLEASYDHAVDMLAVIAEFRDTNTGNHINRIAMYTTEMAKALGLSNKEAEFFGQSARLHDVGKVGIPDDILLKEGPLTDDEFEVITTHTLRGVAILKGNEHFELAADVCHYHHERWDGNGYPAGLIGENIPLVARIVSIVDVFDALISRRCYKDPWPIEKAVEEIKRGAGTQFDPDLVSVFIALFDNGSFEHIINSVNH